MDLLALTETWFTGSFQDNRAIADINRTLPNFSLHHLPRPSKGGGVGVLIRDGLSFHVNETSSVRTFEHLDLTVTSKSTSMRLFVIYRPPGNNENKLTSSMFLDEFSTLLESLTVLPGKLLMTGDFNVHVDDKDDREASLFANLLHSFGLRQHNYRSYT